MKACKISILLATAILAVACSSSKQMKTEGELVCSCDPSVLSAADNKIEATVSMEFPEGYFNVNATMVVTPVIVYPGGQRTGQAFVLQGEKVKANYKVIPKAGKTISQNVSFEYLDGMEQCWLELRCVAIYGEKKVNLPAIKVADGCNVTYKLAQTSGEYSLKADGFERVTTHSTETNIMFDLNSAYVKNNATNNNAVALYKAYLDDLKDDPRYKVLDAEIVAFASPEGGVDLNANLSERRADAAVRVWKNMSGDMKPDSLGVRALGQDWEGFQEAMANSDIEDKDLILRVLSMYSDPDVREREIRNLSFIYEDIKADVFPSLRRATFVVNAEHIGYSNEELVELAQKQLALLTEPEILHLATISDNVENQKFYYRVTTERYESQTGYFNLAVIAMNENKMDVALAYLTKVEEDADVLNLLGVVEMRRGKLDSAANFFRLSGSEDAKRNLGTIKILQGKYGEAAAALEATGSANETLSYILVNEIGKAMKSANDNSPRDSYIAAVAAARAGNASAVREHLAKASADPYFAEKALKDVEFVDYR